MVSAFESQRRYLVEKEHREWEEGSGWFREKEGKEHVENPVEIQSYFEQGSTMAMDVDDVDPLEVLGEGVVSDNKLADADFFNSFEDDFDDSDIN
ncbi:hypothetical protein FEM48_Zijuj07G0083600 [Ziziphus jujuba var. spinosa]|uniref:Small acidic protein 1 n=1 Tax=Ziziphus jujuba var. spinosa TaxID=714518 RepID=A0A978V3J2_ZIZJJ|nr:hypothetical protein FEM48_Zijuj07G0083600 [Ziziphus jujuba var. spinosa]